MALLAMFRIVPAWCYALLLFVVLAGAAAVYEHETGITKGRAIVQAQWDAAKLVQAEAAQKAEAANRATESRLKTQVIEAQNENQNRIKKLQLAATAARTESDGLRDDLAAVRSQLPSLAADAVRQYAATATDVLNDCQRNYQELAAKADGHASDALMYQQAWPK